MSWEAVFKAFGFVAENPIAERPYMELERAYRAAGMENDAEAVRFLIGERFENADGPDPDEEQRGDGI